MYLATDIRRAKVYNTTDEIPESNALLPQLIIIHLRMIATLVAQPTRWEVPEFGPPPLGVFFRVFTSIVIHL